MTVRNVVYKGGDPEWARAVEEELNQLRRELVNVNILLSQDRRN